MDDFARLSSQERHRYFNEASERLNLTAQFIEKDFWVCWCLKHLFSLSEFQGHLTFKGGTSLSKVYHVIERFSEDVDVAIERTFLGFGDDNEPEKGHSGKEQQRRVERLQATCQSAVANRLQPQLREAITTTLGGAGGWSLSLDPGAPDRQSLLFEYPAAITGSLGTYFAAAVKIELGARSDHFPVEDHEITPFVSDEFPDAFGCSQARVRVLAAARTFWEKVTILHRLHHLPEGHAIPPRMSRHYYDVFRLSQSAIWKNVLDSLGLLDRVVEQTTVFFKRAWARYEEARRGMLRLSPPEWVAGQLKQDYRDMRPMFFGEPPPLVDILAHLPELEKLINESKR